MEASLKLEKAHVESRIVRDQDRVLAKTVERRQHLFNARLGGERRSVDAVDAGRLAV